jgi:hypothetical protein
VTRQTIRLRLCLAKASQLEIQLAILALLVTYDFQQVLFATTFCVPYFTVILPSLVSFHPFTSIFSFILFVSASCFVPLDSLLGLRLLLFVPYRAMYLPFVILALHRLASHLGPLLLVLLSFEENASVL